jgi:hypothetical protein
VFMGLGKQTKKRRQPGTSCFWWRIYLGRYFGKMGVLELRDMRYEIRDMRYEIQKKI